MLKLYRLSHFTTSCVWEGGGSGREGQSELGKGGRGREGVSCVVESRIITTSLFLFFSAMCTCSCIGGSVLSVLVVWCFCKSRLQVSTPHWFVHVGRTVKSAALQ